MPTPLGHALSGIAITGGIPPPRGCPGALWTGLAAGAASLPDWDTLLGLVLAGGDFRVLHRGFTHGLPLLVLLSLAGGWLLRGRFGAGRTTLLLATCFASHLLLDFLTGAGPPGPGYPLGALEPFSDIRFHLPWSLIPGTRLGPGSPPWGPWNVTVLAVEGMAFGGIALLAHVPRPCRGR